MSAGRPSDYDPAYCEMVIDHLGGGYSLKTFAAVVDCNPSTLYEWEKAHPEFSNAIKKGRAKGMMTWETGLMTQAIKGTGNTAAHIFAMKNLYPDDWRDKQDHEHKVGLTVNISGDDADL